MKPIPALLFAVMLLLPIVYAADPLPAVTPPDCSPYEVGWARCNGNLVSQVNETAFYKNRSDHYEQQYLFYKEMYESRNISVTNRELIAFQQNLSVVNNNINNFDNRVTNVENTLFHVQIGIFITAALVSIELVWMVIEYFKRKKKPHTQG